MNTPEGFKLNWTAKEKAVKEVEEEIKENQNKNCYYNLMTELGIEVLR